jgi:Ca-activated chloride channel homolog
MVLNTTLRSHKPLGGLYTKTGEHALVFPLKHTQVLAKVAGNLSRVEVTQTFENSFAEPLEAIYIFPLPDAAVVDEMEIKLGDRVIKGGIKKREEAQLIYEQARQEGRTAGLLEQERDNIFTQSLANIKPGERIDVTIRYTDTLKFSSGECEFVFPMVVGPRFCPGIPIDETGDSDRVADASRIMPTIIPPSTRSGHDIQITVEIDAGVPISNINSPSHQIRVEHEETLVRVLLGEGDTIPNKDLILRYQVSGDRTQATVLTQSDTRGGHFVLYLIPAVDYSDHEIVPKDVVFLIDTSGSQKGDPFRKSQELMRRFIQGLNPQDTFTILDFSDITTQLSAKPLANTPQNRIKALTYINQLKANGGTYLLNGIRAVLNFPAAPEGRLRSIVLLTDGYIGNESEILAEVKQYLKPGNRLYSFGVGSSPNRFLLNRIAELGRGTSRIVRQDESTQEVTEEFLRQINNPVITTINVEWQGMGEAIIYPTTPPDLFTQQPLVLFGRISPIHPEQTGILKITGTVTGGKRYEQEFHLRFESEGNCAIAQLWGRARIKDLMNQMWHCEKKTQVEAIIKTALTYQILAPYTAFVAVSEQIRTDPQGKGICVSVPVEVPEGVSYEGIFDQSPMRFLGLKFRRSRGNSGLPPSLTTNGASSPVVGDSIPQPLLNCTDVDITPTPSPPVPDETITNLQVLSVTGLEKSSATLLTQHLQQVILPSGYCGELVFEFPVCKGRVVRVLWDEDASSLNEAVVIDVIKRSLLSWRVPQWLMDTVRLTLRIKTDKL